MRGILITLVESVYNIALLRKSNWRNEKFRSVIFVGRAARTVKNFATIFLENSFHSIWRWIQPLTRVANMYTFRAKYTFFFISEGIRKSKYHSF